MNGVSVAVPAHPSHPPLVASESQRLAIEADLGPVLVLAGPGAGKTYCLIERIRYVIEQQQLDPERICAFTFTNKAAEEIASRLSRDLGPVGRLVRRGTIHSFCADILREFGEHVRLPRGFGIADEEYQKAVLGRMGVPARSQGGVLRTFTLHRLLGRQLNDRDTPIFERYLRTLEKRRLVDFDGLVIKARELIEREPAIAAELRSRWEYVLVDEFQDLNPAQYAIIQALVRDHRNLFAVGDDEQSIFSWTGADPKLFSTMVNDFGLTGRDRINHLLENHRCSSEIFSLARRLVAKNAPVLVERRDISANRPALFPVHALTFSDHASETAWLLDDLARDQQTSGLAWGEYAILYRKHEIGDSLEGSLISAGIPCQLAQGRALGDDPVVAYVLAALRVIAYPSDGIHREQFLRVVLPQTLCAALQARADEVGESVWKQMLVEANQRGSHDEDGRKLRRARAALRNLEALRRKHTSLSALVDELLSQRVGEYRTVLEDRHEELSDPEDDPYVVRLADRLARAWEMSRPVWLAPMGAVGIPVKAMLSEAGFAAVHLGGHRPAGSEPVTADDVPSLGIALGMFKALQLMVSRRTAVPFRDFTVIDLETTDRDVAVADIVDIAAVRVRDGVPVAEYHTLVRPRRAISAGAAAAHHLTDRDVGTAPYFETVWPAFRAFCGSDTLVAHNGYQFDFPILRRVCRDLGLRADPAAASFCTYDTLVLARELRPGSRRLEDLAHAYGVDPGQSHRALDDTRTLARVCVHLETDRLARARKIALVHLLGHLGVALALSDEAAVGDEARNEIDMLLHVTRGWALSRYGDALEQYRAERDRSDDVTLPTAEELIDLLGGAELMTRIRAERTADQRYPAAMARLRRLLDQCRDGTLSGQIASLLEHVALSRSDGATLERGRVNLLTLHSTKGLEFSRVYIVGVEDSELPGIPVTRTASTADIEEGRRVLYVGMTRAKDRLVLTRSAQRGGRPTGGHQFLDEMGLIPTGKRE